MQWFSKSPCIFLKNKKTVIIYNNNSIAHDSVYFNKCLQKTFSQEKILVYLQLIFFFFFNLNMKIIFTNIQKSSLVKPELNWQQHAIPRILIWSMGDTSKLEIIYRNLITTSRLVLNFFLVVHQVYKNIHRYLISMNLLMSQIKITFLIKG